MLAQLVAYLSRKNRKLRGTRLARPQSKRRRHLWVLPVRIKEKKKENKNKNAFTTSYPHTFICVYIHIHVPGKPKQSSVQIRGQARPGQAVLATAAYRLGEGEITHNEEIRRHLPDTLKRHSHHSLTLPNIHTYIHTCMSKKLDGGTVSKNTERHGVAVVLEVFVELTSSKSVYHYMSVVEYVRAMFVGVLCAKCEKFWYFSHKMPHEVHLLT